MTSSGPLALSNVTRIKAQADQLLGQGRPMDAARLYRTVCALQPRDGEAWVKLSMAQRAANDLSGAEASARRAVLLLPASFLGHYALGLALHGKGARVEALACYRAAAKLAPYFPDLHYLSGLALQELGRVREAETAYRQAIAGRSNYIQAMSGLAAVLMALGDMAGAEALLGQIIALAPDSIEALANLAALRIKGGAAAEGMELYRRALELGPGRPDIHAQAAELMERMGNVDEAKEVIAAAPGAEDEPVGSLVMGRIALREDRFEDGLAALRPAREGSNVLLAAEADILAGQLLDRLGRYEDAFQIFAKGKGQSARAAGLDIEAPPQYLKQIALAQSLLTPGLAAVETDPGFGAPDFLIGFPRSGTTLLEQVLGGHPKIQTLDEVPAVTAMANGFMAMMGDGADLETLSASQIQDLRDIYFAAVEERMRLVPGMRLLDKLPLNLIWAPLIWRVFPQAKFILALRHPMDCCLSCFMQPFSMNEAMSSFVTLEGAAQVYAAAMTLWRSTAASLPLAVHTVRYEDLVRDLPGQAADVLQFLELDWDPRVLTPGVAARNRTIISTPSYQQVERPIYSHAINRWRRYERQVASVAPVLEDFIAWAGYPRPAEP